MKLNTNSNVYTVVYAAVLVIVVAFLLAFVSSSLKNVQDANVANDTKGQILTALRIDKDKVDVEKTFNDMVQDMLFQDGQLTPYEGKFLTSYGAEIKDGNLHVFVATTEDGVKYVIPITGRGLWGGIWGYVALNEDRQTVYGAYFYHEGETAGLGARIGEAEFRDKFCGKVLFADGIDGVALTVVKSGTVKDGTYQVDGVTGATLTSNGVANMLRDGLSVYQSFICCGQERNCCADPNAECCWKDGRSQADETNVEQ